MVLALQEMGVSPAQYGSLSEADQESIREIRGLADTVKLALPHVERSIVGGAAEVSFDNEAIVAAEDTVRTYMLALRGH